MTKIRPINPDEIIREKAEAIPDQVIAGYNESYKAFYTFTPKL